MNTQEFDKMSLSDWRTLCRLLKKEHANEGELEVRFEDCLHFIFGWSDRNIKRQKMTKSGSKHEKRMDINLYDDENKPIFIFEMKRQGHDVKEDEVEQLSSYMMPENVRFGFLVWDKLSLYYNEPKKGKTKLKRVFTVSFSDKDNEDGAVFARFMKKSSFCLEEFSSYYTNYLAERESCEEKLASGEIVENLFNFNRNDENKYELIRELIILYKEWLANNDRQREYLQGLSKSRAWITENIIKSDLGKLSDDEFVQRFEELKQQIPNDPQINQRLGNSERILQIREAFQTAVSHLIEMSEEDKYHALDDFTGKGDFAVKYLQVVFWTEMIRIRFPDVPLYNPKTQRFFDAIGVYIGDYYEERLKNVSAFYQRFSSSDMNLDKFSHLEHFAVADNVKTEKNEAGLKFIRENFHKNKDDD